MKFIPFFLQYLCYFKFYSLLFQAPLFIHYSSQIMSSTTGFTEFVQPTTPPKSTTPSISSVPNNTPADNNTPDQPLIPQLAIQLVPIEEDELSSIDYRSVVEDPDSAPAGFIHNELEGHHFYPIHVPNLMYGKWDHENRTKVAKYIQYNADYTNVTGTEGRGHSKHTIPVYISRQTHYYTPMTAAKWREFRRGAPQEFLINEAIADMADPRVVREVNRLQGKMELRDTLDKLRRDTQHRLDEIMKEYTITKQELTSSMVSVECANLYNLIQDHLKRSFPTPVHASPEPSPLIPCTHGPVEMPILMDGHPRQVKCFRCRKRGHKAQECPWKKERSCTICGDRKHRKAGCPFQKTPKVEVEVEVEVRKEVEELGKMTLLDRIALLDRPHWTPPVCAKCGEQQPGHGEMECPRYEYCGWCKQSGSYGFIGRHRCQVMDNGNPLEMDYDDRDADLWANND